MVLWFFGHKKTWFPGSMVVKNQVLWFYGRKKLWSSGSMVVKNYGPLVTILYFCTYVF